MWFYKCNRCGGLIESKYQDNKDEREKCGSYYLTISGQDTPFKLNEKYYCSKIDIVLCESCMKKFFEEYHIK